MSEAKQADNNSRDMHPVSRAWMWLAGWGLFLLGAVATWLWQRPEPLSQKGQQ
ncbi:MAG: hypothetical protein JAZ13_15365 [Candidatus Thiodiazotropha taylori]|nr:hypothetical protein [Candidatus Thiodiazotropha taylori]